MAGAVERTIKIVALGDSLTAGFQLPAQDAFPVQLEKVLKAKGAAVEIANAGVSGDTSSGGLARLAATVAVILPLVLVWIAVGLARAIAELRAEAVLLRTRMEALRPAERAAAERAHEQHQRGQQMRRVPAVAGVHRLGPAIGQGGASQPVRPRAQ